LAALSRQLVEQREQPSLRERVSRVDRIDDDERRRRHVGADVTERRAFDNGTCGGRPLRRRAQQVGLARPRRAPQQDSGFRRRSSGERHQRRHRLGVGAGDKVVEGRRFWPREVENELLGHGQR
jgi:hypothetical protein